MSTQLLSDNYVSKETTSSLMGISVRSLERMHAKGEGPKRYNFGKFVRYSVDDIHAWMRSQQAQA